MKKRHQISRFLFEVEGKHTVPTAFPATSTHQQPDTSLDAKIDHFLVQYEKAAQPQQQLPAQQVESFMSNSSFINFLFEADDPLADLGGGSDAGGGDIGGLPDLGGGDDSGGGNGEVDPRDQVPTPRINIQAMAGSVARLINNFEQLVDPKTTLLNRVNAFMLKNYNETVAREFMISLDKNFGLSTKSKQTSEYDGEIPMGFGAGVGDLSGASKTGGGE